MEKAKWIWYDGEYEIYHHWELSFRREEFGNGRAPLWQVARPYAAVRFYKEVEVSKDTVLHVYTRANGYVLLNYKTYPLNRDIMISAGKYRVIVELFDKNTFPSMFIDNEYFRTDETWKAGLYDWMRKPVGCTPTLYSPQDDPSVFPFSYKSIQPICVEEIDGGMLYDFGKETFGPVTLGKIDREDEVALSYGESRGEALDFENAIIREILTSRDKHTRPSRAFRYIFVKSKRDRAPAVKAKYEYLPIKDIASFSCDEPLLSRIWEASVYTFHLNTREFYLDGIKRDRWVWSGDAYQSFMINRYLYSDDDIIKRTIVALLGKPPYDVHINTINDYSAYLIIAVWEYYYATGDGAFVRRTWDKIKELYGFIVGRLDKNGYTVPHNGDWIFIDWGDVEKEGATCAEQILLWATYRAMGKLALLFEETNDYALRADTLKKRIFEDYYRADKGWFIDSFSSGTEHVSRQANILAAMYGLVNEEQSRKIAENVLLNEKISPIQTPYFKFYELSVLSGLGYVEIMQDYLETYWGQMLERDATSVWEQFDPTETGEEQYAMYGMKYGKSLCHAWGSGPIYLLGRYCCGVYATDIGYKTFAVQPNFGKYKRVKAVVPVGKNIVNIDYNNGVLSVKASCNGGRLIWKGQEYTLSANERLTIK